MSRIVQEKFEVRPERKPEGTEGGKWATDRSARRSKSDIVRETRRGDGRANDQVFYNSTPPGMDIEDQEVFRGRGEPTMTRNSRGNGTQATVDVTAESLRTGFDRKKMLPTDDMYTREHNDAFYDTVEVDGVEGFVERNNYLDRL
jgi:hypothetical protein